MNNWFGKKCDFFSLPWKLGKILFVLHWNRYIYDISSSHLTWFTQYDIPCMQNIKRNYTNELIYKTEIDSDLENKLMVTKGNGG